MKPNSLRVGDVYFIWSYQDSSLRYPVVQSLVFIGVNLEGKRRGDRWFFQDTTSYVTAGAFPGNKRGAKVEVHRMDKVGLELVQDAEGLVGDVTEWASRRS